LLGLMMGGAVALIFVVALLIWNQDSSVTVDSHSATDTTDPSGQPVVKEDPDLASLPQKKMEPADALYALVLADPAQEEHYRIGSAIAIGPRLLLASATCRAIGNLAHERFPSVVLQGAASTKIKQFVAH